jgi:hypothetical protein
MVLPGTPLRISLRFVWTVRILCCDDTTTRALLLSHSTFLFSCCIHILFRFVGWTGRRIGGYRRLAWKIAFTGRKEASVASGLLLSADWIGRAKAGKGTALHVESKKRDEARIGRKRRVSSGRMWPATAPLWLT